ncbi:hypothetical protein [Streptococcus suis]|uniref:Uncharacterized protein n=1 Tax=Streptococcus suis TaxID=1307 RepID=A0A0Z8RMX7_STRSU|nr:hypothetical protein [Streptococcus suis]MDW8766435.1 hypothetical protein [Streptococcus suis]NQG30346.1 hypothetical protein [Streptococcus suis]NQK55189.1 hypothetical protein [Streptococcus suis]NQK57556.1 hypothetical protein [Streptococcus suis]NQM49913.1 hypothetical protein [Streptococcus suis]
MVKGILIKVPELFTDDEQLEIQEKFKSKNIEVIFFDKSQIQASFDSFIELILSREFVETLVLGLTVDILKELVFKIVGSIKKKKVVIIDSNKKTKPAKLTIKSTTDKGTIYLEIPSEISDKVYQESIEKIVDAKKILDNSSGKGINDLFIVEDKPGNLSIMTLNEYIIHRKNQE